MFHNKSVLSHANESAISKRPTSTQPLASSSSSASNSAFATDSSDLHTSASSNASRTPASASASSTPAPAEGTSPSRLIVGPNVKLKGAEILDCDTLVVEGRVEATMDSRVLTIAEKGSFSGKVGIDVAEIHGQFEGELSAREQLIIHATGRVKGKIRYGKLLVESGGLISGDIESLSEAKPSMSGETLSKVTSLVSSSGG